MPHGYNGKLLRIDLSSGKIIKEEIPGRLYRKYLGGSGLGGYYLTKEFAHFPEPFSPENPLIFIAGLLCGLPVPTGGKSCVVSRSPLTGIWGEATVGGHWGARLKSSGHDGIIVTGESDEPVFLSVSPAGCEILPAGDLWGKDTFETSEILTERIGKKAQVACIGPAGENLVRYASIMIGGDDARALGRCGMGAVMGKKKLKAIVVSGDIKMTLADPEKLKAAVREDTVLIREAAKGLTAFGTSGAVEAVEAAGDLPIQNWRGGEWKEGAKLVNGKVVVEKYLHKHYACYGCPIVCAKKAVVPYGPYKGKTGHSPEYETIAAFGGLTLNEDIEGAIVANDLCNRLGLDTISTGAVIAFAMEAYENGLITEEDAGRTLNWGDPGVLVDLPHLIAYREKIGDVLAEGVRCAAEKLGGNAEEFAIHAKGLEFPYHDPRAFHSMAVNYATANRGACHLEGLTYFVENGAFPAELIKYEITSDRFGVDGKADLCIKMQNFMNVLNAAGLCKFIIRGKAGPEKVCNWINLALGWDMDYDEIMKIGDRLHNLKRMYNVKLGIGRKDDRLPSRLATWARPGGGADGQLPHVGKMLWEYYKLRKWNEQGIPEPEKLEELELSEALI
ncbi:MAG: aldehyde ferredoxin oxidoreductase family protein [Chloroflexi bacterium]|nr:aldehyde ferredoxin oxidoreductase family protein [Chloroflexota bacterium]